MAKKRHFPAPPVLLSLWSTACLIPLWLTNGPNGVAQTYFEGAWRFWTLLNPYAPAELGDIYQYPPFFALLYGPFVLLPRFFQCLFWGWLNAFVFWEGLHRWVSFSKKQSLWLWLAWILAAMELDISLRYHQINALLTGLILIGVDHFRHNRLSQSAFFLATGINLKILPVAFAGALSWPLKRKYFLSIVFLTTAMFFLPVLVRGWEGFWALLDAQYHSLHSDLSARSITDLKTVLERLGYVSLGASLQILIATLTITVFGMCRVLLRDEETFPWRAWISFGLVALLLLNPRTESPTFVMAAPTYLLLMQATKMRWAVIVAAFFVTVNYTSVWPQGLYFPFHHLYGAKSIGCFILWILSGGLLCLRLKETFQGFKFKKPARTVAIGNS